jgi:hypothetical protein
MLEYFPEPEEREVVIEVVIECDLCEKPLYQRDAFYKDCIEDAESEVE